MLMKAPFSTNKVESVFSRLGMITHGATLNVCDFLLSLFCCTIYICSSKSTIMDTNFFGIREKVKGRNEQLVEDIKTSSYFLRKAKALGVMFLGTY